MHLPNESSTVFEHLPETHISPECIFVWREALSGEKRAMRSNVKSSAVCLVVCGLANILGPDSQLSGMSLTKNVWPESFKPVLFGCCEPILDPRGVGREV